MNLGGLVCIRNGRELDYCWRESIQSLLPVCDTVTVCDGESTDGTQEEIRAWCNLEPKLNLCVYPWPYPKGDSDFWVKWLQYGRMHCPSDFILQLDADEVLHESAYPHVRFYKQTTGRYALKMKRWNFWRDTKHLIPPGVCCGHEVIRMGPQDVFIPSDGAHPMGAEWVNMAKPTEMEIFHYGFLRERSAFFRKAKALQGFFFDTYDKRLEEADKAGGNWMTHPGVTGWEQNLIPFTGNHPEVAKQWLQDRFYEC